MKSASEANELVLGLVSFGVMLIASEAGFQWAYIGQLCPKRETKSPALGRGG